MLPSEELAYEPDAGTDSDEEDSSRATGVRIASTIREALESQDDEALYDALYSLFEMHESMPHEEAGDEMPMPKAKGKKPSLTIAMLRGK